MLDHAVSLLKPDGRLVFCTCSLLPDEGEVQVEEALVRHPYISVDRAALDHPGIDPSWITDEGGFAPAPRPLDGPRRDGWFLCCLLAQIGLTSRDSRMDTR